MAVVYIFEVFSGRVGGIDDKRQRHYKRVALIQCDDKAQNPITVRNAPGVAPGDIYTLPGGTVDAGARCKKVEATQRADQPFFWDWYAEFHSDIADPGQQDENPLNRPAVITIGTQQYQVPSVKSVTGEAILTPAGEPFDPAPQEDDARMVMTIEKNVETFNYFTDVEPYINTVNKTAFLGFPDLTLKVNAINATSEYENGVSYWKKKAELHFRKKKKTYKDNDAPGLLPGVQLAPIEVGEVSGWDHYLLAQGSYYLDGNNRKVVPIDPQTGLQYSRPLLLNAEGRLLAYGKSPVYVTYPVYKDVEFSGMNLP